MPRRPLGRVLALTPVLVLASCTAPTSTEEPRTRVLQEPPTAEAPPDPGVAPPPVRLLDPAVVPVPVDRRPQGQLADWAESMADGLNIPRAALQAYGYAERVLRQRAPECGIGWSVLAGIGAVESSHGRFGGARLDRTGRPSSRIRGLPLDGREGVRRIEDTDGGKLDGDPRFERAMGPLQFIPQTWRDWGVDADGDGVADPDDIDDAALTAGELLCASAGDIRRPDRFWTAMLEYNNSRDYGQDVLDHADHYGKVSRVLPGRD